MAAAAITAPKSDGQLFLAGKLNPFQTAIVTDPDTRAELAGWLRARGAERRETIWSRDADLAEAVQAILFIGLAANWYPANYAAAQVKPGSDHPRPDAFFGGATCAVRPRGDHDGPMFLPEPPPSDAAATLYADDRADTGYVDNLTRLWCWRPEVLTAFTDVRTLLLSRSRLSATDIAVIVTATANARADSYCALAWGRRLTAEIGEDAAEQLLRGSTDGLAARHVALARWAHRVAVEPNTTTPDDVAGLRSVGFDDLQIFEATVLVAMRLAFSTVNDALGAEPDAQLAAAAPAAVRAAVSFGRPAASAPST